MKLNEVIFLELAKWDYKLICKQTLSIITLTEIAEVTFTSTKISDTVI